MLDATNGTTRQACAADPTAGLLPALGLGAVAAVVGVNREPDIGLGGGSSVTGATASTVALARQAALAGLPTIAVCLPASSASDSGEDGEALAAAAEALEVGGWRHSEKRDRTDDGRLRPGGPRRAG